MNLPAQIRPGSAVRGAGVALACLMPSVAGRARAVGVAYAVGWPLDRPGLQVLIVVPDEDEDPWKRASLPLVTSGASWSALMLVAVSAVRRSKVPAPIAAVVLGGAVAVGDSLLADFATRVRARAAAAADESVPAESVTSAEPTHG